MCVVPKGTLKLRPFDLLVASNLIVQPLEHDMKTHSSLDLIAILPKDCTHLSTAVAWKIVKKLKIEFVQKELVNFF